MDASPAGVRAGCGYKRSGCREEEGERASKPVLSTARKQLKTVVGNSLLAGDHRWTYVLPKESCPATVFSFNKGPWVVGHISAGLRATQCLTVARMQFEFGRDEHQSVVTFQSYWTGACQISMRPILIRYCTK
ncbi:hypothetical protein BS78_10G022200 [Paspalum vaginatum]|nr:hypothetical protein BS78_10G022200 [Paspalum vaginatum]